MSRRNDFQKILKHEKPDRLLIDMGGNPLSSMEGQSMFKLMDFIGFEVPEKRERIPFGRVRRLDNKLLEYFDIDMRSVGTILRPQDSQYREISENEYVDEWGIRRIFTGMYWDIVNYPLKNATVDDLEKYKWPDPDSVDMNEIESYANEAKRLYNETDYVICAEHPVYGILEMGCWLCGYDDFLLKMAVDKEFVIKLIEIIFNYQIKVIKKYYGKLGKYIHYTSCGDDFGTQDNLLISPKMFRELIKPYFKERVEYTKKLTRAAFLHHSCGSVFPIIDDLIECGVDILNPIQPKATNMSPELLKKTYGSRIVFHGGFDTQELLPFGTKEEIEEGVEALIKIMNRDGGYIFATSHNIQDDVPAENVYYMLKAARKFGD
jgi:uroporphyrinogen decarboxylase